MSIISNSQRVLRGADNLLRPLNRLHIEDQTFRLSGPVLTGKRIKLAKSGFATRAEITLGNELGDWAITKGGVLHAVRKINGNRSDLLRVRFHSFGGQTAEALVSIVIYRNQVRMRVANGVLRLASFPRNIQE